MAKLGKKIADTQASAAKKGAQLKAGGKQLDKLRKDAAKAGMCVWLASMVAFYGMHVQG